LENINDLEVQHESTRVQRVKAVHAFKEWLASWNITAPVLDIMNAPLLLGLLVKEYGRALFRDDQPLYLYLYLLTALHSLGNRANDIRDALRPAWNPLRRGGL